MINKEKYKPIIIVAVIVIIVISIIAIKIIDKHYEKNQKTNTSIEQLIENNESENTKENIKIYITGEVQKEGVIELETGSRIADAIEKAGGLTDKANIKNVNLAYELQDGQKIYIPNKEEINVENPEVIDDSSDGVVNDTEKEQTININKADLNELQNLPGVGESIAQAIIKYREENGKFKNVEDLKQVSGIGDSKYAMIKDNIKIK